MKKNFLILLSLCLFTSCMGGGAKGTLHFEEAIYPISASKGTFLNEEGDLAHEKDYEVVGAFRKNFTTMAFVWGVVSLENKIELGQAINEQVKQAGGDAVQNLEVKIETSLINMTPVLSLLPFWPSLASGSVKGDIIRYKKAS